MAEARVRDEWRRTAALMALTANCSRDPRKTRPFKPTDFDPFARPADAPKVGVDVLKDIFIDGKVPPHVRAGGTRFTEEHA